MAKQIAAFVGAIFNSIAEIAGGNIGKAIAAVENALAKALPVSISFLAALVGIGGIAAKIKENIRKIRKPIEKAVGKAVGLVAGKAKALIAKMTGGDKPKEKPPRNQAEHDAQVKAGLAALDGEQRKLDKDHDGALTFEEAENAAKKVKAAYPVFKAITAVEKGDKWVFEYVASPKKDYVGFKTELDESIRAYRGVDISTLETVYKADKRLIVEMEFKGKGTKGTNSEGWVRNPKEYFKEVLRRNPEYWSISNRRFILLGRAPEVDELFIKYFPQYREYLNDTLKHHHIGGGGQAFAIPARLHVGSGGIHMVEKRLGIWGADASNARRLQTFVDEDSN